MNKWARFTTVCMISLLQADSSIAANSSDYAEFRKTFLIFVQRILLFVTAGGILAAAMVTQLKPEAPLVDTGRGARAEATLRAAATAAPTSVATRCALAKYLLHTGRTVEAAEAYQAALEIDATCVDANAGLFYALYRLDRSTAATRSNEIVSAASQKQDSGRQR